jgi:arsenate reductase
MKIVLFACVHNAGRSQMAAAIFNQLADPTRARAVSAGTDPGTRVHPEVATAMQELGLNLTNVSPQRLTEELASTAAMLITMGCGDACPVVPGAERDDWPLQDPKGQPIERVRGIRTEIATRVRDLLTSRQWLPLRIRPAERSDRAGIEALLLAEQLPLQGVAENFGTFFVADHGAEHIGSFGLEIHGDAALLRSVVVQPNARKRGFGTALTLRALAEARRLGAREVFVLTTSAVGFFAGHGFARVERAQVPAAVLRSPEFSGACPASAIAMRRAV